MTQFDPYSRPQARRRRTSRREQERPEKTNNRDFKKNPPRQKRHSRQAPKKRHTPFLLYVFFFAALIFLGFSYIKKQNVETKLYDFKLKQAQAVKEHEDDLAYYANMRSRSGVHDIIQKYAQEFRVHPSLVSAVIARESHYDPYAQSGVGARGLMQIMEDTGSWIAGKLKVKDYNYDLLFDPDINIRFGCWYLSYLSNHYGGNPLMVASAYHAGMSNVNLWALRNAKDGKNLSLEEIPMADTKDYVKKVMNAYALYYEWDTKTQY
ncbi:MAG: lytic transglycosylase domain-containing protein [Eubacteriales bacterium]|nr:lytic transglycosylase domain-containing protein [Eubacteriales bacterium]